MMGRPIDHVFERVTGDHIRVVDLRFHEFQPNFRSKKKKKGIYEYTPKVDSDE
jgi:hypothetical protein